MKKQTALFLALLASAGFFLFLFLQTVFFAPPGITVYPARRTVAEDQRIELNLADEAQLQQLPGIGPTLSAAIVSWREEHGGFRGGIVVFILLFHSTHDLHQLKKA